MCGIVGIFNSENAFKLAEQGLQVIRERGKEAYGIAGASGIQIRKQPKFESKESNNFALAHCLHSVVGFVPQPMQGKGILAANCEIYNWKEIDAKYNLDSRNDAEMLLKLLDQRGISALDELDGVYSFAYWNADELYIARDILGIKPMWFSHAGSFMFASEKKAIEGISDAAVFELNPRRIIVYSIGTNRLSFIERDFFTLGKPITKSSLKIEQELAGLVANAVAKRVPDKKFGLLFSGGVDSSLLALILKRLGLDFICYLAVLDEPGLKEADDLSWAQRAASELGLKLKIARIRLVDVPAYLQKVVPLIEDTNPTKVAVGLTFYAACELARKDKVKVIFSGLGSEEIFAGYERHKRSSDINKECYFGLLKLYERDTYRDDVITMANNIELRLPYLDMGLIRYALHIPADLKLDDKNNKLILRKVASNLGMSADIAARKKRAAQYGSRFDSALEKLSRKSGFRTKSEYLRQFYPQKNLRLGALFSSGKDSTFAIYTMLRQNYEVCCLITMQSANPDSYMFHTPNIRLAKLQAESMQIPILEHKTSGEKESELTDLKDALGTAIEKYKIEGIITGALFSNYQRERIEKAADSLGLKVFSPLWHMNQELELRSIIDSGFRIVLSSIAALGLDKTWLGKEIGHKDIDRLVELNQKYGINVAGEGGEFESLVLDGPIFRKKLKIISSEIEFEESPRDAAKLVVKKAVLEEI